MRAHARAIVSLIAAILALPAMPVHAVTQLAVADAAIAAPPLIAAPTLSLPALADRLQGMLPSVAAERARLAAERKVALARAAAERRRAAVARASRARALAAIRHLAVPAYGRISEGFGARGLWSTRHTGIDIDAPYGSAVHSVVAGIVVKSVYDRAYGNLVVVRGHGVDIWYAHLARRDVRLWQKVRFDQTVGFVGCTGRCFGPHLHLEVRKGDLPTDPAAFLWGSHRGIAGPVPAWARRGITTLGGA